MGEARNRAGSSRLELCRRIAICPAPVTGRRGSGRAAARSPAQAAAAHAAGQSRPSARSMPGRREARARARRADESKSNAWVEDGIGEIDGQVDRDEERGVDQDGRLDDGVVPLQDGVDGDARHPRDVEHDLHHERPGDRVPERHAHRRHADPDLHADL